MISKFKFLIFGLVFLIPSFASAICYEATGFTTYSYLNDTWLDTGTTNDGKPVYSYNAGGVNLFFSTANTRWAIDDAPPSDISSGWLMYQNDPPNPPTPDYAQDWTQVALPYNVDAGRFASTTCPGETEATTSLSSFGFWGSVASSSMSLINSSVPFWEIALGAMLAFFLLFFLVVGLSQAFKRLLR